MELDRFVRGLRWEDLGTGTREMARRCVLDALGCALSGLRADRLLDLVEGVRRMERGNDSPLWGTKILLSLPWAIFFNSYMTAFFDLDDGHRSAQGHPGAAIIPAALCTAYHLGASGKAFLEAVIVGYEIAIRSALLMREMGGPRKGSGAWIVPGVAAAVGRLMSLDSKHILWALGAAEFMALQAPQDRSASYPSLMKEGLPWGAYTGYMAAFLTSYGLSGMRPYLADSPLLNDLGEKFEIERVYFKRYACCRWAHPAIDGLAEMLKLGYRLDEIDQIQIRTFGKALLDQRIPSDTIEALYSIPFAVASYMIHGKLGPKEVSGDALKDPRTIALYKRIHLVEDPELTKFFPEKCLQQIVVTFKTGEHYSSDLLSAKGDPDNPLTDEELLAKFRTLTEDRLGQRWEEVAQTVRYLDKFDVAKLVDLLSGSDGNKTRVSFSF